MVVVHTIGIQTGSGFIYEACTYGRRELRGSIQIKKRGSAVISGSFRYPRPLPPSLARPEAAAAVVVASPIAPPPAPRPFMASVPKPLQFLRPLYPDLEILYDPWSASEDKP
ncbi:hypothetical protein DFH08DRAFT_975277 [Mycena albidolilacea]|uniref:RPN1 N-terminal domain-containing protein n=1 Tax=Mycena albidolilacea TaxID=1033008 RepID=A0AAD7EAT0_9AGAR|nr:hypothetical protein DFH08DRAFT_975277 [Mycena albidolilacea]